MAVTPSKGSLEVENGAINKDKESGTTTLSDETCMWPTTLVSSTATVATPKPSAFVNPIIESTWATEEFETDHWWCGDGKVTTENSRKEG